MGSSTLKVNPFQPDAPVRTSVFTGRSAEIAQIRDTIVGTLRGQAAHVLVIGERGIGKTSLTQYVVELALSPDVIEAAGDVSPPIVLFVSLGYCGNLADVCAAVLNEAYRWARRGRSKVTNWFKNEVSKLDGVQVSLFGIGVSARLRADTDEAPRIFPELLEKFLITSEAPGLVVILDETEAIAQHDKFPGFLKATFETLGVRRVGNIEFVMTVTPEGRSRMANAHPSFPRLFRPITIEGLSGDEVTDLVRRALEEGEPRKTTSPEFLEAMRHYSSGIPSFVHEIGRAAFEVDSDNILDDDDFASAVVGTDDVVGALTVLEQKHFRERYSQKILSNTYREILHAMAELEIENDEIATKEIRAKCPEVAQIDPYLGNMVKRGVIMRVEGKRGIYRLPDRMFGVFLRMESQSRKASTRDRNS